MKKRKLDWEVIVLERIQYDFEKASAMMYFSYYCGGPFAQGGSRITIPLSTSMKKAQSLEDLIEKQLDMKSFRKHLTLIS